MANWRRVASGGQSGQGQEDGRLDVCVDAVLADVVDGFLGMVEGSKDGVIGVAPSIGASQEASLQRGGLGTAGFSSTTRGVAARLTIHRLHG